MRTAAVLAEYRAISMITADRDLDELVRHGVARQVVERMRPALAKIAVDKKGELYTLDEAGRPPWILPVCVPDPEMPDAIARCAWG